MPPAVSRRMKTEEGRDDPGSVIAEGTAVGGRSGSPHGHRGERGSLDRRDCAPASPIKLMLLVRKPPANSATTMTALTARAILSWERSSW